MKKYSIIDLFPSDNDNIGRTEMERPRLKHIVSKAFIDAGRYTDKVTSMINKPEMDSYDYEPINDIFEKETHG